MAEALRKSQSSLKLLGEENKKLKDEVEQQLEYNKKNIKTILEL